MPIPGLQELLSSLPASFLTVPLARYFYFFSLRLMSLLTRSPLSFKLAYNVPVLP